MKNYSDNGEVDDLSVDRDMDRIEILEQKKEEMRDLLRMRERYSGCWSGGVNN
jgi:hypothetical protein